MYTSFNLSRLRISLRVPTDLAIWKLPFCPQCTPRFTELTALNDCSLYQSSCFKLLKQELKRDKYSSTSKHILRRHDLRYSITHGEVIRLTSHVQYYAVLVIQYNGGDSAVRSLFLCFRQSNGFGPHTPHPYQRLYRYMTAHGSTHRLDCPFYYWPLCFQFTHTAIYSSVKIIRTVLWFSR
jgi:hypothetical protein